MEIDEKNRRVLILDPQEDDADQTVSDLLAAGIPVEAKRIEDRKDLLVALDDFRPEVILSELALMEFTVLEAVRLLNDQNDKTPIVLVTNSLDDELSTKLINEGAFDCVVKGHKDRLATVVARALEVKELRDFRREATVARYEGEEKLRGFLETTNEWIWDQDLQGRITYTNAAVRRMLGIAPEKAIGKCIFDLLSEDDIKEVTKAYKDATKNKTGWSQWVRRFRHKDGGIRFFESNSVPILDSEGNMIGLRGSDRDITKRKVAEEQLVFEAFHDSLTGLANRTLFMEHLQLCIKKRKRRSPGYAVLYLDFDRFKVINDSLGHSEGDNLLRYIARRLESCTRQGDLIARFGGDEFVILLDDLSQTAEALLVAERILNDFNNSFNLSGNPVFISTSIGIALSSSRHTSAEEMVRDADIAMYSAKGIGGSQYRIFDEELHSHIRRKLQIETDLRTALEKQEFRLFYQPIVCVESKRLAGFEALLRWQHPTRGTINPNEFIPIAEENGLILRLGQWTVGESCRQLKRWQQANPNIGDLTVSVNLSSKEFRQPELAKLIAKTLKQSGLDPKYLKLEITESHVMEDSELAVKIIGRLRKLGLELSLDDFGTGYSSLSYLHRLPFSCLKIDRSFINQMNCSAENYEIVSTIIKLARSLKMKVVAEGIESSQQAEALRKLGCDFAQGYLFSKPLRPEDAKRFIDKHFAPNSGSRKTTEITKYLPA